jgi:hypothetical protein
MKKGLLLLLVAVAPSVAHHNAGAMYDLAKSIAIKGTITNVEFRNPHSSLSINVRDADGKIIGWQVELASIATLTKAGLNKDRIDLTQSYSMQVFPAKSGTTQALGLTLTFPDGTVFEVGDKPMEPAPAK